MIVKLQVEAKRLMLERAAARGEDVQELENYLEALARGRIGPS
ncbi:hypothetical protein [Longimicrobium terrae]|uniref:Uncharacterized protein n=1 Tax=Longimicrobium terrae TaxID=1639882 RepID=A0A841H1B8_9BACT|nr:hypothetical protein [Longimicrobium terrae]MBB4637508.1 hypothetical protein [Longimicrobium terrae]MBB6071905.1 hypothetical protein [Longimicrobium terrae]